jgi:hypothetical protein
MFVRKFVSLAFLLALALPIISHAEGSDEYGSRYPASTKHHKAKKGKKGKAKKAKGAHHAKNHKGTHAPSKDSGVNHTPPEMKEDLPAPSAESTTEH